MDTRDWYDSTGKLVVYQCFPDFQAYKRGKLQLRPLFGFQRVLKMNIQVVVYEMVQPLSLHSSNGDRLWAWMFFVFNLGPGTLATTTVIRHQCRLNATEVLCFGEPT